MSMLASTRGSGATGLLEQPAPGLLPQPTAPDTAAAVITDVAHDHVAITDFITTDFESSSTMTITASVRGTPTSTQSPVHATVRPAEPTPPATITAASATSRNRTWIKRINEIASRMDGVTQSTAAQRATFRTSVR